MAWVLCGGPPLDPPVPKFSNPKLRNKSSDLTVEDSSTVHEPFNFDADDDGGDYSDCELEWDSWTDDLMRQALVSSSNGIAVTVTEPASMHPSYPGKRIRPTASSSTFSSITLSEGGRLPSDILPGANMGLLSVDSPALLTAPSVLPFQSTGITTSTVSAGGIVRTRSLIAVGGRRGRGVPRAMEVLSEDGDDGPFAGKYRTGRQKRTREENGGGAMASSAPAHSSIPSPPPLQLHGSSGPFYAEGSPRATSSSVSASASALTPPVLATTGGNASETASIRSGITTMTTTTTIPLLPRRGSTGCELLDASSSSSSQKRGDKAEKEKGKGKQAKGSSRGKVFRSERLVSKIQNGRAGE